MKKEWVIIDIPTDNRTREYLYHILSVLGYELDFELLRDREFMKNRTPHLLHFPRAQDDRWIVGPFHYKGPDKKWREMWPEYQLYSYPEAIKFLEEQLNIKK